MDKREISAVCATVAALAALCVPGSAAFAADGHAHVERGRRQHPRRTQLHRVQGRWIQRRRQGRREREERERLIPGRTTDAWVKAALNKNGVTYNTSEGRNAAEQLLRLKTNSDTLRKVAGTLQSTAASSRWRP